MKEKFNYFTARVYYLMLTYRVSKKYRKIQQSRQSLKHHVPTCRDFEAHRDVKIEILIDG